MRLRQGRLDCAGGLRALEELRRTPPRVPRSVVALAYVPLVVGVALIIQPTLPSVAVAAVAALVVVALDLIADRARLLRTSLFVLAAFGTR